MIVIEIKIRLAAHLDLRQSVRFKSFQITFMVMNKTGLINLN